MAKKKYNTIGSIVKSKDPTKNDYVKIGNRDVVLKAGSTLSLESKKSQLERLAELEKTGKLSGEMLEKLRERANRVPDFVRFEVIQVVDEE